MTDSKRLYEQWKVNGKDPTYYCEHKKVTDSLLVQVIDDVCNPCNGFNLNCEHYRSEGRRT